MHNSPPLNPKVQGSNPWAGTKFFEFRPSGFLYRTCLIDEWKPHLDNNPDNNQTGGGSPQVSSHGIRVGSYPRRVVEPTPFPDLNSVLAELVRGARAALEDNFCGAYLQGSFAVGDADAHSDVDFIVVTGGDAAPEQQAAIKALHQRLYALPTTWAQHLEGSYVPRNVLHRPDPDRRPLLYLDNGATEFALDSHDNTAVVRWSLRERGVTLAGPNPRELIEPITADVLRADVRWAVGAWRRWFGSIESIDRRALAVAVLSHARILHTLAIGEVSSKRAAGQWALHALDHEWASLIRWALEDRPDPWTKVREPADPILLRRTRKFIDYAAGCANEHSPGPAVLSPKQRSGDER
jgi:aminoglycoside adenylyltransferase-like protein